MGRHCGFCYGRGHNRTTCPKLKEHAENNPGTYWAQVKNNIEERKKAIKTTRKCSWCKEPGHTKRTCQKLKMDIAKAEGEARIWNKSFLDALKEEGLGVGALIKLSINDTAKETLSNTTYLEKMIKSFGGMGIIIEINEEDCYSRSSLRNTLRIRGASGVVRHFPLPYEIAKNFYAFSWSDYMKLEVVGKVDHKYVNTSFSTSWIQGQVGAKKMLGLI
jgi:hypothetical protein